MWAPLGDPTRQQLSSCHQNKEQASAERQGQYHYHITVMMTDGRIRRVYCCCLVMRCLVDHARANAPEYSVRSAVTGGESGAAASSGGAGMVRSPPPPPPPARPPPLPSSTSGTRPPARAAALPLPRVHDHPPDHASSPGRQPARSSASTVSPARIPARLPAPLPARPLARSTLARFLRVCSPAKRFSRGRGLEACELPRKLRAECLLWQKDKPNHLRLEGR